MIIKILCTVVIILTGLTAGAQRPNYVPFQYQGKTGIMQSDGKEFLSPGSFGDSYLVVDDFKSYIVTDNLITGRDFVFNAISGKGEKQAEGQFDARAERLSVSGINYYHFSNEGVSILYSATAAIIELTCSYLHIEPNNQVWANERNAVGHLLWALKADGRYDILDAKNNFSAVKGLPDMYSYDLIFESSEKHPAEVIGFVFGDQQAIRRDVGQNYDIPQSDGLVEVYDINFKRLGTSAYRSDNLAKLFGKPVLLRGGMKAPPQLRHEVIVPNGTVVVLNDEFSLIPNERDKRRMVLVNSRESNKSILGPGDFDYRYFSTADNLRAMLQIRHGKSGSIFYFDFDGNFFPKGLPMIPKQRMDWK